jgi:hypothetical protein
MRCFIYTDNISYNERRKWCGAAEGPVITWPMPIMNVPEPPTVKVIWCEILAYTPQADGYTGSLRSTESVPDGQLSAFTSTSHVRGRPRIISVRRTPWFRAKRPSRVRLGERLENVAWAADDFVFTQAGWAPGNQPGPRTRRRQPPSWTGWLRTAPGQRQITPKQGQSRQTGQQMSDRGDEQ